MTSKVNHKSIEKSLDFSSFDLIPTSPSGSDDSDDSVGDAFDNMDEDTEEVLRIKKKIEWKNHPVGIKLSKKDMPCTVIGMIGIIMPNEDDDTYDMDWKDKETMSLTWDLDADLQGTPGILIKGREFGWVHWSNEEKGFMCESEDIMDGGEILLIIEKKNHRPESFYKKLQPINTKEVEEKIKKALSIDIEIPVEKKEKKKKEKKEPEEIKIPVEEKKLTKKKKEKKVDEKKDTKKKKKKKEAEEIEIPVEEKKLTKKKKEKKVDEKKDTKKKKKEKEAEEIEIPVEKKKKKKKNKEAEEIEIPVEENKDTKKKKEKKEADEKNDTKKKSEKKEADEKKKIEESVEKKVDKVTFDTTICNYLKSFMTSIHEDEGDLQTAIDALDGEEFLKGLNNLIKSNTSNTSNSKKKTTKDKNAPKRARSSYIYFCMETRTQIKTENPEMNSKDVTRTMGTQWKSMTEKEKKPFTKQALDDKERNKTEMESYVPSDGEDKPKRKAKNSKKKKGAKRASSAYLFFCSEKRAGIKEMLLNEAKENSEEDEEVKVSSPDVTRALGKAWQDCKNREQYDVLAAADKARFLKEKEEWVNEDEDEDEEDKIEEKKVDKKVKKGGNKVKKVTSEEKTIIRKTNGYIKYLKDRQMNIREENPTWKESKINSVISTEWIGLEPDERAIYEGNIE